MGSSTENEFQSNCSTITNQPPAAASTTVANVSWLCKLLLHQTNNDKVLLIAVAIPVVQDSILRLESNLPKAQQ